MAEVPVGFEVPGVCLPELVEGHEHRQGVYLVDVLIGQPIEPPAQPLLGGRSPGQELDALTGAMDQVIEPP